MKKSASKKIYKTPRSSWIPVGITVMILLFLLAFAIKRNRVDEPERGSKSERIINKIEEARQVKNSVKKLVK